MIEPKKKVMKNSFVLLTIALVSFSCKTTVDADNLPKPVPETQNNNSIVNTNEAEELENMKTAILNLVKSESCDGSAEWKAVGLGAKACGGPVSYIAYPVKIETELLEKVEQYNQKSAAYNKKHNLISDCMLVLPPDEVVCENGNPVFKYSVQESAE